MSHPCNEDAHLHFKGKDAAMRIQLDTMGGFANLPGSGSSGAVDTRAIAADDARTLESLVNEIDFFDLPSTPEAQLPGAADFQVYVIRIDEGERSNTIKLTDPVRDQRLRQFLSAVQQAIRAHR
jgi:hypothetical protein